MDISPLHRQVAEMRKALFDEGFVDEQFVRLEELQDNVDPNFLEEIITSFYRTSGQWILNIEQELEKSPVNFPQVGNVIHRFKGSSSSIGAAKVLIACREFTVYCRAENGEGCKRAFQQLKEEHEKLKTKLQAYFQQARQAGPIETASSPQVRDQPK